MGNYLRLLVLLIKAKPGSVCVFPQPGARRGRVGTRVLVGQETGSSPTQRIDAWQRGIAFAALGRTLSHAPAFLKRCLAPSLCWIFPVQSLTDAFP